MKTTMELCKEAGFPLLSFEGVTYVSPELERLVALVRADERAAPVQEPAATLWQHGETGRTRVTMPGDITDCDARWFKAADLYTTPPAARRQWVGLTDKEIGSAYEDAAAKINYCAPSHVQISRAIEAKLKEKNT
jgi:hypothetical protein